MSQENITVLEQEIAGLRRDQANLMLQIYQHDELLAAQQRERERLDLQIAQIQSIQQENRESLLKSQGALVYLQAKLDAALQVDSE